MENNLYYTPELNEFHIGFECEILGIIGAKEDERLFSQSTIITKKELDLIHLLEIRVKYLDQSDIESLGWLFKTKGPFRYWFEGNESWFNNTIPDSPSGRYWEFQLIFDPELHTVQISAKTNDGIQEYEPFFQGTIKNLSELKKLMQQLNIC